LVRARQGNRGCAGIREIGECNVAASRGPPLRFLGVSQHVARKTGFQKRFRCCPFSGCANPVAKNRNRLAIFVLGGATMRLQRLTSGSIPRRSRRNQREPRQRTEG
jgi:hypothetical protein